MQVQRKGKRDAVQYLGEPLPTVLPPLCWLQEPAVSKQCPTPTMINLRDDRTMPKYAIHQANPFSDQLSQHHIWWKIWFGLELHWATALAYSTERIWLRFSPNTDEEVHSCRAINLLLIARATKQKTPNMGIE